MESLFALLIIAIILAILYGIGYFLITILSATQSTSTSHSGKAGSMDEGDYHSGTEGYSPNTAYPETQYGGGYDYEEDEHNR